MTRLTMLIIATNDDIHVEVTPSLPCAFWITEGEYHRPLLTSDSVYSSFLQALEAGWEVVKYCKNKVEKDLQENSNEIS